MFTNMSLLSVHIGFGSDSFRIHPVRFPSPCLSVPIRRDRFPNRVILHNILNVQMVVDYEKECKQQNVMIQLDIMKACDHVSWSFITQLMSHMGFGEMMSSLYLMLGLGVVSHVMLNVELLRRYH